MRTDKITPLYERLSHGEGVNKTKTFKAPYGWEASTIVHLLKKREYLGHTVNFKTRKHFRDKKGLLLLRGEVDFPEVRRHIPAHKVEVNFYLLRGFYAAFAVTR